MASRLAAIVLLLILHQMRVDARGCRVRPVSAAFINCWYPERADSNYRYVFQPYCEALKERYDCMTEAGISCTAAQLENIGLQGLYVATEERLYSCYPTTTPVPPPETTEQMEEA